MADAEVSRHWTRVARLGCCISHEPNPTLHHVHGGSMSALAHKGMGQKTDDWLVIPLAPRYHSGGPLGIDAGSISVEEWEELFGRQVDFLEWVSQRTGVNVFNKAGIDYPVRGIDIK